MTSIVMEALVAAGSSLTVSIIVKATAVSVIALLAAHLARNSRASAVHLVFVAAFVTLLVIPIASIGLPALAVPVAVPVDPPRHTMPVPAPSSAGIVAGNAASIPDAKGPVEQNAWPIHVNLSISAAALLFGVWTVVGLIVLSPLVAGLRQLFHVCRDALPWLHGEKIAQQLAPAAGIRRRVAVLLHESVTGPMTCGFFRPAVLFPVEAATWDADDVRRAMIHELEHIRRGDWLVQCGARAVCSFYWFHPLVWMLWRRLSLAAERACDDAVLSAGELIGEPIGYARQLLTLAERLSPRLSPNAKRPLLAMASPGDLPVRVTALLSARQHRGRTGIASLTVALASALLLALIISPVISPVPAAQSVSPNHLAFEVASIKPYTGKGPYGLAWLPGGRVQGHSDLSGMIRQAYGIPLKQLEGDSPILNEMFDIEAKAPANTFPDEMPARREDAEPVRKKFQSMMQTLLAERFHLALHTVTKDLPVYALVIAKNGAKNGPKNGDNLKLLPADFECRPVEKCGFSGGPAGGLSGHVDMPGLAQTLAFFMDRQVVDRTGLKGLYQIKIPSWNPTNPMGTQVRLDDNDEPQPSTNDASIFTVLQEQLGLKLESGRAPLELSIVDHVERPVPN